MTHTPYRVWHTWFGLILLATFAQLHASLQITEFSANSNDSFLDSDEDASDWIELKNTGPTSISTFGYALTDVPGLGNLWQIPAVDLASGEHLIVFASGKNRINTADELHADFSLAWDSGYLALVLTADGSLASEFNYPKQFYGISYTSGGYFSQPTPGIENGATNFTDFVRDTNFSVTRGFFETPFSVEITTATPDALIYYTTDGTVPSAENGILHTTPIPISETTLLRATATKPGWINSNTDTQSYIFLSNVIHQPIAPEGFPDFWGIDNSTHNGSTGHPRPADYEMDPDVLDSFGEEAVLEALQNHPSISVVMDPDDLWNESDVAGTGGLYPNPYGGSEDTFIPGSGTPREWEQPCSIEFIGFEKVEGAQLNCGIRMSGNFARHPNRYKHHLRITSRREYGPSKIVAPVFSRTDVDTFDDLILRGGNSESWTFPSAAGAATRTNVQYVRDQYYKDMQVAMGHLSANQEYFHLYLNGLYWGFYTLIERIDGHWMSQHLGGEEEDYDIVKKDDVLQEGTRDAWDELFSISRSGVSREENYTAIQDFIDLDNLIDYMIFNFWAGTVDWEKNWRGGRRRVPGAGFLFFNWDGERGLGDNFGQKTATYDNTSNQWSYHATELHHDLRRNEEYRMRFGDRIQKHFYNAGVLTEERSLALYNARIDEVRPSLIAESARWGDLHRPNTPYTILNEWEDTLEWMNDTFFTRRNSTVLRQFDRANLYPDIEAPVFSQYGGEVPAEYSLEITAPEGAIYFTTDGTDPRLPGGEINATAGTVSPLTIFGPTHVKARALDGDDWSALVEATFVLGEPANSENIVVSEIYYNPPGSEEDHEFIELLNVSEKLVSMANVSFDQGITYHFPLSSTIAPGERLVLTPTEYAGQLDNSGEVIRLMGANGIPVQSFFFHDDPPWPNDADGRGRSLTLTNPTSLPNHNLPENWLPSITIGGSPGTADTTNPPQGANLTTFFLGTQPLDITVANGLATISVPRNLSAGGGTVILEISTDLNTWEPGGTYEGYASSAMVWSVPTTDRQIYARAKIITSE